MTKRVIILGFIIFSLLKPLYANDATPAQFFYVIKNIFPDCEKIAIFVSKDKLAGLEKNIARSAKQFNLKPTVYVIESSSQIGGSISKLSNNSVLVIYCSKLLSKSSSKIYILSKCKKKQITLATTSKDYVNSGALLGLITSTENNLDLMANLKQNEHLKSRFTPELIQKIGFKEVIQ